MKYPLLVRSKQLAAVLFFTVILSCVEIAGLSAQDSTPLFTPFPTPEVDMWDFPLDTHCREVELGPGPAWRGITIGRSTIDELETLLNSYGAGYTKSDRNDRGVYFSSNDKFREVDDLGIPHSVYACVQDGLIAVLNINGTGGREFFLDDWVAELGVPDAVTWGLVDFDRTVFWFEQGLAVSILTGEPFGLTVQIVYFPYQPVAGYENRWPFKRTAKYYVEGDEVRNPPLPTEQNPFDFDSMLATMTAEPTRTPTPTFTPQPN